MTTKSDNESESESDDDDDVSNKDKNTQNIFNFSVFILVIGVSSFIMFWIFVCGFIYWKFKKNTLLKKPEKSLEIVKVRSVSQ